MRETTLAIRAAPRAVSSLAVISMMLASGVAWAESLPSSEERSSPGSLWAAASRVEGEVISVVSVVSWRSSVVGSESPMPGWTLSTIDVLPW